MTDASGDRSKFFPAIEKKHGQPVSHFLNELSELTDAKYPEQIAYLRENHGFSQAHANAVVMHFRGSITSKRFSTPKQFFAQLDPQKKKTAELIFSTIMEKFPKLELVIAWNQPMLRIDGKYVFGLSASKNHLTLNPFSSDVLESMESKLAGYKVNKNTFIVPVDWKVDATLLRAMVSAPLPVRSKYATVRESRTRKVSYPFGEILTDPDSDKGEVPTKKIFCRPIHSASSVEISS